jgi:hypothetical protein
MYSGYKFGDIERLSLFWNSPNAAGSFVACLIPLIWLLRDIFRPRWCTISTFAVESALWGLLALTFSRGAAVAALCALAVRSLTIVGQSFRSGRSRIATLCLVGLSLLAPAVALMGSRTIQFTRRLSPSYIGNDSSVANRLKIWTEAPMLANSAPIFGWGAGHGGYVYTTIFTEEGGPAYGNLVSSYLDILVEQGYLIFAVMLAAIFLVLQIINKCFASTTSALKQAASLIAIIWLVSNLFSSLWEFPTLWILPGASTLYLGFAEGSKLGTQRLVFCILAGCGITSSIALWASRQAKKADLVVFPEANGAVRVQRQGGLAERETILVLTDETALGAYPGRVLVALLRSSHSTRAYVVAPAAMPEERTRALGVTRFVAIAYRAGEIVQYPSAKEIILFDPTFQKPLCTNAAVRVFTSFQRLDEEWQLKFNLPSGTSFSSIGAFAHGAIEEWSRILQKTLN